MYNSTEQKLADEQDEAKTFVKAANGVKYSVLADPTLVSHRSYKNHAFQSAGHATDTNGNWPQPLLCRLLLQSEFVNAKASYIKFEVAVNTTGVFNPTVNGRAVRWNSSVLDLFHSVRLTARDGTVMEYIENLDTLASTIVQTTYETDYLVSGAGRLAGYSPYDPMSSADAVNYRTYIVPLKFFLGLASAEDLLPPQILDGATLEIQLNNVNTAICRVHDDVGTSDINIAADSATAAIRGCTLVTDSYLFDHKLHSLIQQEYEKSGIAIKYTSWTNTRQNVGESAQKLAFPICQSSTRATKLIAKMTTTATETKLQSFNDQYTSREGVYGYTSIQAHHADRSIPDRPLTQESEIQFQWLAAFHKAHGGCTAVAREFTYHFPRKDAFVMSLDRAVGSKATSGVTVSTKWPLRLEMTVTKLKPPVNPAQFLNPLLYGTFDFQRYLDTWLEHERVVVCSPQGMRVLI